MTCREFLTQLHAYVDGELGLGETLAADAHRTSCPACESLAASERRFRRLLRSQPRETAPPALRERIVSRIHRSSRLAALRPWVLAPAAAAAAAWAAFALIPADRPPVTAQLVDKHIAFAQIEGPAEFRATDPEVVKAWFVQRAGLRVTVPDYSSAGIRLIGARVVDLEGSKTAYVLYEKGHTLLSVFATRLGGREPGLEGTPIAYRGHRYLMSQHKGFRTVAWADGQAVFGLVSMLDADALLACADRLRTERARETRL